MPPARLIGMTERVIYESSNGGVWVLARDPVGEAHREIPAKRQLGEVLYGYRKFSRVRAGGPEHQALLKFIGTLLDD